MVQRYLLKSPTLVLDVACGFAIKLAAVGNVFKSNKCDHNQLETTGQSYYDLDLISSSLSAVPEY